MKKRTLALGVIVLLTLALLAVGIAFVGGCFEPKTSLSYETISGLGDSRYREIQPLYLVAADLTAAAAIQRWANPAAEKAMGSLNYEEYFVIAVFQGEKTTGGYKAEIARIIQCRDQVEVKIHFTEPKPGQGVAMSHVSPTHIVKVKKAGMPQRGRLTFIFRDDISGQELARQEHTIP
jgi:hypothetical protein